MVAIRTTLSLLFCIAVLLSLGPEPTDGFGALLARLAAAAARSPSTRRQALQDAKRTNDIPLSRQPVETVRIRDTNTGQQLRQYNYLNNRGQPISIREDIARQYGRFDGRGDQGPHFNAGPSSGKLKQHYYFTRRP